eukprot:TRINITY_DN3319_c3_g4_i5.p1 TRINITY_DN3319_c3_g4~~TRINITY_DN3319_c3_g4_i5.p1  ORF type:complete len:587 (+),score=129.88 TRINITY_DN3319_c3_g4_i5:73-1833(+)
MNIKITKIILFILIIFELIASSDIVVKENSFRTSTKSTIDQEKQSISIPSEIDIDTIEFPIEQLLSVISSNPGGSLSYHTNEGTWLFTSEMKDSNLLIFITPSGKVLQIPMSANFHIDDPILSTSIVPSDMQAITIGDRIFYLPVDQNGKIPLLPAPPDDLSAVPTLSSPPIPTLLTSIISICLGALSVFLLYQRISPSARRDLVVDESKILGKGSHGTVVFEGKFGSRSVAVKRLLKEYYNLAEQEIDLLIRSDHHSNIVSYYTKENDGQFIYIALEKCPTNLFDLVNKRIASWDLKIRYIRDILTGLAYLHKNSIVHRDLKPQNILVGYQNVAKISDMALGKFLDDSQSYVSGRDVGSAGYQAPEVLRGERMTNKVDIFSFGCIVYFVLTDGNHPFGGIYERDQRISRNRKPAELLAERGHFLAQHFVDYALTCNIDKRPSAEQLLGHPIFWNPSKKLKFLLDVSDYLEFFNGDCQLITLFNDFKKSNFPFKDWQLILGEHWKNELSFHNYDNDSIQHLLRFIRNKKHHYRDLNSKLQEVVGALPDGFLNYFTQKFPQLLPHCYTFASQYLKGVESLKMYLSQK